MGRDRTPRESILQGKILKDLRFLGNKCLCFKIEKASEDGIMDIFFTTIASGPVFVETKRITGSVSNIQEFQINKMNRCGSRAFKCYTWDEWIIIKRIVGIDFYFEKDQ